jgi:RHS repeat-associated protein
MAKLNPFRFSTKYQDDETDLVYYGRRYLNTSTGRWLNRDPIGEEGGINLYSFVDNNPFSYIDPPGSIFISREELGAEG